MKFIAINTLHREGCFKHNINQEVVEITPVAEDIRFSIVRRYDGVYSLKIGYLTQPPEYAMSIDYADVTEAYSTVESIIDFISRNLKPQGETDEDKMASAMRGLYHRIFKINKKCDCVF